jgi:hypothetical protein
MVLLADPIIELHDSSGTILIENDNWKKNQQSEIAATGLAPSNDAESALITTLGAGSYTVIERGKLATTGVGLVEVYDLGAGFGPELGNISTRGFRRYWKQCHDRGVHHLRVARAAAARCCSARLGHR